MIQQLLDALRLKNDSETIALPPGTKIIPNEFYTPEAAKARGCISMESLDSLISYTRNFCNKESIVTASLYQMCVVSVLDWHDPENQDYAGWGEHSCRYDLSHTAQWLEWTAISGKQLSQQYFAEFIEEHLDDIKTPSSSEVLTVATTLSGKRNIKFTNATNLGNGDVSLQWEENTEAKAGGDTRVPSEITISIPVFKGSEAQTTFEIKCLFRYRIAEGRLSFEVKLLHADKVSELAFAEVLDALRVAFPKEATNAPQVLVGRISKSPRQILSETIQINPS